MTETYYDKTRYPWSMNTFGEMFLVLITVGLYAPILIYAKMNHSHRLTENRLTIERGVITTTEKSWDVEEIEGVEVFERLLDPLFNFGSVTIQVRGNEHTIHDVKYPHELKEKINEVRG